MSSVPDEELVERVVEITGASITEATYLLGACNNNPEAAVLLFFEKGGAEDIGNGIGNGNNADLLPRTENNIDNDEVRPPIAPIREQLLTAEADNFVAGTSSAGPRFVRPAQRVKICPLRDFAREGALMEEQMKEQMQASYNGSSSSGTIDPSAPRVRRALATFVATSVEALESAPPGSSRLEDLFRPPTDIAFSGTFQAARNRATAIKHWLLVNVQNDSFNAQLLNRDVWANKEVRKLVRKRFILWQIDSESIEGRRFITFYHCAKLPYVCIIDPRTGEEVWKSSEPKDSVLINDIKNFLLKHNDFGNDCDEDSPSTSKRNIIVCDDSPESEETKGNIAKRPKILELSEEEQIAVAIRNSIKENGGNHSSNDDEDDTNSEFGSIEEFVEDDTKNVCKSQPSYEEQLGTSSDSTTLKLRFLNAEGSEETVQLLWPSDTLLKVLRLYITQKHPHIVQQDYKLICAFPRKTLETTDDGCTLKEIGLHPSANIHVSQND